MMWIVAVIENRINLFFLVFWGSEVRSEAITVVKKVGSVRWKKILEKLFSGQLTWVFVLQDNSKSSLSVIAVGIPLEREALHVGTVFLVRVETLKVINEARKKNSFTVSLWKKLGSAAPQKVSSSTLSQSTQLEKNEAPFSTSKCSNSREICLSGTVIVTWQFWLFSYCSLLTWGSLK